LLVVFGDPEPSRHELASILGCDLRAVSLSRTGDLTEAARRLFAALRELDSSEAEVLFAEPCPVRSGLGHAIADRLERAAARNDRAADLPSSG
jgi:L-threonylcarbamoyladenylate synthase